MVKKNAAIRKRIPLNEKALRDWRAFCTRTKVVPQMNATSRREKSAVLVDCHIIFYFFE